MHFATYTHRFVIKDQRLISRKFIVLKREDGTIQFTDFHRYVKSPTHRVRDFSDDGNNRFDFICKFLNYAFFECNIGCLDNLTVEVVADFLKKYGTSTLPSDSENSTRSKRTVERCISVITDFIEILTYERKKQCKIKLDDLFVYKNKRDKHGHSYRQKVLRFDVNYICNRTPIFRDIPNKAFDLMFHHIATNHKRILGLVMLSAFAGLRPSEACNVRRTDSPLGPGMIFEIVNGHLIHIEIDLRKEMNLRSDLISVGKIKKERMQAVPDIFLEAFQDAYNIYTEHTNYQKFEADYGAFTVNSHGKAMTYESYRKEFQRIVKDELIPIFLSSNDEELVRYGRILMEHNISPHVFRHWYTVQLVLSGVSDPGTLMYYRGDTSPESALTYLQNKGELEKQYKQVNNELFNYMLWASEKQYDRV